MIAPMRLPAATRSPAPAGAATAGGAPPPLDCEEPESAAAQAAVEARIAALVARTSTLDDEALARQHEEFDFVARAQAETDREINALRDMAMEQVKQDDELLKKWIELI